MKSEENLEKQYESLYWKYLDLQKKNKILKDKIKKYEKDKK